MTALLLDPDPHAPGLTVQRARARDRVRSHVRAPELDRRLAEGVSPDASAALSLRARHLLGPRARREVSRSLRRAVRDARGPRPGLDPRAPVCRRLVLRCESEVDELVRRLLDVGPIDVRGVALARLIVSDGMSPLYGDGRHGDLVGALRTAIRALAIEPE